MSDIDIVVYVCGELGGFYGLLNYIFVIVLCLIGVDMKYNYV